MSWGICARSRQRSTTFPGLSIGPGDAASLARGQAVLVRGRDTPVLNGAAYAHFKGRILALGELEKGRLPAHPGVQFRLKACIRTKRERLVNADRALGADFCSRPRPARV